MARQKLCISLQSRNISATFRLDKNTVDFISEFSQKSQYTKSAIIRLLVAELRKKVAHDGEYSVIELFKH